jgi:SAM-dependent methyltransferase
MDTEGPCADPGNPDLLGSWELVDSAVDDLFDPVFRERLPDPSGGTLRFGWFFLTWTGFRTNPRGRDFGHHRVRDHYLERWGDALAGYGDEQCWHYHQPAPSGVGNEWGLDWTTPREYEEIVSRQVLERGWFPACYRAGGTIMSPVSSRWVDSWFPFDYTNRAPLELPGLVDWGLGVAEWGVYHPDPEDFRRPGPGRRRMARCLDLVTNVHVLGETDVVAAFERARGGREAILSVFDHDYREITGRLGEFRELIHSVGGRYPEVPWRYAAPAEAVCSYLGVPLPRPLTIEISKARDEVLISASEPIFQSFPWIAIRTADGVVSHAADPVRIDPNHWVWQPPSGVAWDEVAVGASTDLGRSAVARVGPSDGVATAFLAGIVGPDPVQPRSIWQHSKAFPEQTAARAAGEAPEMDAAAQAADYLRGRLEPAMSVLDVGCAGGHLGRSLDPFGVDYHGIDSSPRAIDIGRAFLPGAARGRLRPLSLEQLPPDERYDAVVCLSTLLYFPRFEEPLDAMSRACRRWLVIRSSFGDETEIRYLADVLLEPGFQSMHAYFNVFARGEVQVFLESRGFDVAWESDRRQRDRFGGEPEVVGGIALPYEFLLAERVDG